MKKKNPLEIAIRSIKFPFITLLFGSLVLLWIEKCCKSVNGLGRVVAFLPFIILAFLLMVVGIIFGMMWGVAALRRTKELPTDERLKILSYALAGIALSLLELGVFYWLLLGHPG